MLAKTKTYRPSEKEPFMNERQREYFRAKLLAWKEEILKEAKESPELVKEAPHHTVVGRMDEARAARQPRLRWTAAEKQS